MRFLGLFFLCASAVLAQALAGHLRPQLEAEAMPREVVAATIQQYLLPKAPKLPAPRSAAEWTRESGRLRRQFLDEIVFGGWPKPEVEAKARFEEVGTVSGTKGYSLHKFRYEIVPGMQGVALLYEPENLTGKTPGVLNVNGHAGPRGKWIEAKQKRCVMQAKMGLVALNLEWIGCGELYAPENSHSMGCYLDLYGMNALGLFYLNMRRGLDFLYDHPHVDRSRLAVTGLSGGGWQTILLSSLDERVKASIPVAGYSDLTARVERKEDIGDYEQNAPDMMRLADYSHLTAMRAPRPTLLIYNAQDDCCFKAPLVKAGIYDAVRPFFRLYGEEDAFAWHENMDPGTHNYGLDNRLAAYRFLARAFGLTASVEEPVAEVAAEMRTFEELRVGVPKDNLTILGLARKLSERAPSGGDRSLLAETVRYQPVSVAHAWPVTGTRSQQIETRLLRLDFSNGLPAVATWVKAIVAGDAAPETIIMDEGGKQAASQEAANRVNRGERVLVLDPLLLGTAGTAPSEPWRLSQMMTATGERPLGIQAAQLIATARWLSGDAPVRVECRGFQTQLVALVAAALEPAVFSDVVVREGIESFAELFDKPVEFREAPAIFCQNLGKRFDIPRLEQLGRE